MVDRHSAPLELSRVIVRRFPPTGDATGVSVGSPELRTLKVTCVEIFRRSSAPNLEERLSKTFGDSKKTEGKWGWQKLSSTSWKVRDGEQILELARKASPPVFANMPSDPVREGLGSVSLVAWDCEAFPFYLLTMEAVLAPAYWSRFKPEELGAHLPSVTHPLRLFLESLGGLVREMGGGSPRIPCVVWAGVAVPEPILAQLVSAAKAQPNSVILWEARDPQYFGDIPVNPPGGFPYRLEANYMSIHRRSIVQVAGNMVTLFGLSHQIGIMTEDCPYCLVVTTDAELLSSIPGLPSTQLSLPTTEPDFLWSGASSMVLVTAVKVWLRSLDIDIQRLESTFFAWRHSLSSGTQQDQVESLKAITSVALSSGSIESDLGVVSRNFQGPLEIWSQSRYARMQELPSPSQGVLAALAQETLDSLKDRRSRLANIRGESTTLAEYTNNRITLESSKTLGQLTAQIARYNRLTFWLTAALLGLTVVLAVLTGYLVTR